MPCVFPFGSAALLSRLAPIAHGRVEARAEMLLEHPFRAETAEIGDGGNWEIRLGEQFQDALQPDMDDFVERRMAHCLAETQVEELARPPKAPRQICRGQAVACLAADHLDGLQNARLPPSVTARGFPSLHHERREDGGIRRHLPSAQ